MRLLVTTLVAATVLLVLTDAAAINKCVDTSGKSTYQDGKCPDGTKQDALKALPGSSPAGLPCAEVLREQRQGLPEGPARKARDEMDMVAEVLLLYPDCSESVPGFNAQFNPAYQEWRRKNQAALANYERDSHAQRIAQCRREAEQVRARNAGPQDQKHKAAMCNAMVGPVLEKLNHN